MFPPHLLQITDRAFTARNEPGNGYVAVCGNPHQSPNVPYDEDEQYSYQSTAVVQSQCMDWQWGTGGTTTPINVYTWAPNCNASDYVCVKRRYMIWWMQNIPGVNNNNKGRDGLNRPDWWIKKLKPESYSIYNP